MNPAQIDVFTFTASNVLAFFWGLLVLVSFIGWGQTLGSWLDLKTKESGWATFAAWGMATFLVFSGLLLMLSLFSTTFAAVFLSAGAGMSAWRFLKSESRNPWHFPPTLLLKFCFVVLCIFILLTYASAVATRHYNAFDDFTAYFPFIKMELDTGTLYDPFNFRLLGSLGGQPALDALFYPFLAWKYVHLLDMGIALIIILGLTASLVPGTDVKAWKMRLLLVGIALTFPMPRNNSASEFTGVVLFMALFQFFRAIAVRPTFQWRQAMGLAGLITATSTLRCPYIFAIVLLGACFLIWRWLERDQDWRGLVHASLPTVIFSIILLAPWWVVTYRSSGAFLYPLFKGAQQPEFEVHNLHLPLWKSLGHAAKFLTSTGYVFFFLPVCFLQPGRERRLVLFQTLAIFLISIVAASHLTYSSFYDQTRYLDPMGLAIMLYASAVAARQFCQISPLGIGFSSWRQMVFILLLAVVLFTQVFHLMAESIRGLQAPIMMLNAPVGLSDEWSSFDTTEKAQHEYQAAFAQIPPGSKTLIALDYPYMLDYRAHKIFNIDTAGAISPPPGLPYFQGTEAVKNYLKSQGIRYIAYVPFEKSGFIHNIGNQKYTLKHAPPVYRFFAKYEVNFCENVEGLAKSNRILYDSPTIQVIDLGN